MPHDSSPSQILPSNVDDPLVSATDDSNGTREWTAVDALAANATEPLDVVVTERYGVVLLIESAIQVLGQALASLASNVLRH